MEGRILSKKNPDYVAVLEVLLQLRPQFDFQSLSKQIEEQTKTGYRIVYIKSEVSGVMAVAGFRIDHKLAWGKHIYIDDLVTNEEYRSTGVGRYLINWFKTYAMEQGCKQIHLDSNTQRTGAHKFYLREGFEISSYHFSMTSRPRTSADTTDIVYE